MMLSATRTCPQRPHLKNHALASPPPRPSLNPNRRRSAVWGAAYRALSAGNKQYGGAFLEGNFAPVDEERYSPALPVEGALPLELDGAFLRIGPNPALPPVGGYHWFDGDGMVRARCWFFCCCLLLLVVVGGGAVCSLQVVLRRDCVAIVSTPTATSHPLLHNTNKRCTPCASKTAPPPTATAGLTRRACAASARRALRTS
jgi:hypothetical protein